MGRLSLAVFAVVFVLYASTAYPGLAPRDAGDMIRCARDLAVAHPPGYPLYMLLGHLWLRLTPLGDAAYRLNLLSASAGALACALLAAWGERRGRWAGWTAGLSLAACGMMWKFSLLAEMYSLQAAFAAGLILLSEGNKETFDRRARVSGLVAGLALVNHQTFLLMLAPLLLLWLAEARRHGHSFWRAINAASPLGCVGLLLYAVVPIRLGSLSLGWSVIRRAPYGSLSLFPGFARPFAQAARGLLAQYAGGLLWAASPLLALAAACGLWLERGSRWAAAALLGLACGAAFLLATRFDVSGWVARSALESAFVLPSLWLCVAAALLASRWESRGSWRAPALCAALAAAGLLANAASLDHRADFSAVDYSRSLRRTLEPGTRAVVRGDTALFALALDPGGREIVGEQDFAGGALDYTVGLPLEKASALAAGARLSPAGVALAAAPRPGFDGWPLYAIRRGRALSSGEPYARDAALAYAFARYNASRLAQAEGRDGTQDALAAAAWDPEDFSLR